MREEASAAGGPELARPPSRRRWPRPGPATMAIASTRWSPSLTSSTPCAIRATSATPRPSSRAMPVRIRPKQSRRDRDYHAAEHDQAARKLRHDDAESQDQDRGRQDEGGDRSQSLPRVQLAARAPISIRSLGCTHASTRSCPPARSIASLSGIAQRCSSRAIPADVPGGISSARYQTSSGSRTEPRSSTAAAPASRARLGALLAGRAKPQQRTAPERRMPRPPRSEGRCARPPRTRRPRLSRRRSDRSGERRRARAADGARRGSRRRTFRPRNQQPGAVPDRIPFRSASPSRLRIARQ